MAEGPEGLKNCAKCGKPSRIVLKKEDFCIGCTVGLGDDEPLEQKLTILQTLVECSVEKTSCGKCIACLRQENGKLRETLEFYTPAGAYQEHEGIGFKTPPLILQDSGGRARKALGKK